MHWLTLWRRLAKQIRKQYIILNYHNIILSSILRYKMNGYCRNYSKTRGICESLSDYLQHQHPQNLDSRTRNKGLKLSSVYNTKTP